VTYGGFVARIALAKANAKQGRKSDRPPISAVLCQVVILRAVSTWGRQQLNAHTDGTSKDILYSKGCNDF
jgi:hypothetical protein